MTSGCNNDTVVTVPSPAEEQAERGHRCRSRVTQYGNSSLEVEIPRRGIDASDRWAIVMLPRIPATFLLIRIPLTLYTTLLYGPGGLGFLLFVALPLLIYYGIMSGSKRVLFSQTNLKITRDSYSLLRKNITWKSYFKIVCVPSHFDDLENGNAIETIVEDSQHPRIHSLEAEVVRIEGEDCVIKHIKLGLITFPHEVSNDEVEWLAEEITRFLRETN